MGGHEATFVLSFRKPPFNGGYTVACGLAYVVDYITHFGFTDSDLSYLETLRGNDDRSLFEPGFISYLKNLSLSCEVDAIPEGTVVFPQEPLVRVCGPIIESQLLESALLNLFNFQSLVATKAARIREAAGRSTPRAWVPVAGHQICLPQVLSASALVGDVSVTISAIVVSEYARSTIAVT